MNLHRMLLARAAEGRPLEVGLIGAGKFGAMYLAQAKHTAGVHVAGIADLAPDRAKATLARAGWAPQRFAARSFADAAKSGGTHITDDALALIAAPEIGIVIDATGDPAAGIRHALACCAHVFRDLRWGVYVTFRAGDCVGEDYVRRCFREYGFSTDPSGRYCAMYKPFHAIGLELGISVASVGLRGEPTGAPIAWHGDVVATAKRDLAAGETLDGEGGYTVYGKLAPAAQSLAGDGLPLGLAHGVKLVRPVVAHEPVCWSAVEIDSADDAVRFRREMESAFRA